MLINLREIDVVPSFHYDVVYLKNYKEYLLDSFTILNEALDILEKNPEYTFLVEQVILLIEFWDAYPEQRGKLVKFARQGRLEAAPGMYVMPDMNMIDGESMFMQAQVGVDWLSENIGICPRVCWIADCWGHHAQLPQILSQCGYKYYVFWRCMRHDVMKNDFIWQGLDGTRIKTHWLPKGYAGLCFPGGDIQNILELNLMGCSEEDVLQHCKSLQEYGDAETVLICNGGDFRVPQKNSAEILRHLNNSKELPRIGFSTASGYCDKVKWDNCDIYDGEFNSAFHGTFTTNIAIKQENRRLITQLLSLEKLSVVTQSVFNTYDRIWRLLLKQQFHDTIAGTITDSALTDCYKEFEEAEKTLDSSFAEISSAGKILAAFNPLSFDRKETVEHDGKRFFVDAAPFSFGQLVGVEPIKAGDLPTLPYIFENDFFKAKISENGYIINLFEKQSGLDVVQSGSIPFGTLLFQMDYGDSWLKFEAPLGGGSLDLAMVQNNSDPVDRSTPDGVVAKGTIIPQVFEAAIVKYSEDEILIKQKGQLTFWAIQIPFETDVRLCRHCPYIQYRTTIHPSGKHYRIRAAFPTNIKNGCIRHEIPFGIQRRGEHEHVAQNWIDYADDDHGLAMFNKGIPGNNVDDGTLLLSLFRSVAMEYKTASARSFNEGIPHVFEYAVMPHGRSSDIDIVRNSQIFVHPLILTKTRQNMIGCNQQWGVSAKNVMISALRYSGDRIFIRIYEAVGVAAKGVITVPDYICEYCEADGVGRPLEKFKKCSKQIAFRLEAFGIKAFLLSKN